jgi:hypothetical protein
MRRLWNNDCSSKWLATSRSNIRPSASSVILARELRADHLNPEPQAAWLPTLLPTRSSRVIKHFIPHCTLQGCVHHDPLLACKEPTIEYLQPKNSCQRETLYLLVVSTNCVKHRTFTIEVRLLSCAVHLACEFGSRLSSMFPSLHAWPPTYCILSMFTSTER